MMSAPSLPATPGAPPPPPMFAQDPLGKKPKKKPLTPTFLGEDAELQTPNTSGKTLLGE